MVCRSCLCNMPVGIERNSSAVGNKARRRKGMSPKTGRWEVRNVPNE